VVLDVRTGEVLAMVNQPSFNPNNRSERRGDRYRNRAVTDVFEPGSTIKPFSTVAALISGKYRPGTFIDTAPGFLAVGNSTVRDIRNYGSINIATVIQKSSNVGISKVALSLPRGELARTLSQVGFGTATASGFPGESSGFLASPRRWRDLETATLSFGYGLSVTALQLAQGYSVLAADGWRRRVSFLRVEDVVALQRDAERVLPADAVRQVRQMLELAVNEGGTGTRARVPGYRVAGKTGTVRKSGVGGYKEDRYLSLFAGMAPASDPRLVMVVVIDEPGSDAYYGGEVAAPVFARVMADTLRLMNIAPDSLGEVPSRVAHVHAAARHASQTANDERL
jgi:cell division protein FtsI (penicillin-binding protein 3)